MTSGFVYAVPASGGGGATLADGNYGDVVVSGSGTIIDIDAGAVDTAELADEAVTNAKLADAPAYSVIGNDVTPAGPPVYIDAGGSPDVVLRMDGAGTLLEFGQVDTGGIADASVTIPKIDATGSPSGTTFLRGDGAWATPGGATLADGDYGDITVSGSGTVLTIDAGVVSNSKLRNSGGLTVIGRSINSIGSPADITAGSPGSVLRLNAAGTLIDFGLLETIGITDDAVTFAKMQHIATDSLIGRDTASTGDPENITLNTTLSMTGAGALQRAALTGDVTASAGSNATTIANGAVTNAKMASSGITAITLHTQDFTTRPAGSANGGVVGIASADPAVLSGTDAENHITGLVFADGVNTWGRFGFMVPTGVVGASDMTIKLIFVVVGAGAGGDAVDIDVLGASFSDSQLASSTSTLFSTSDAIDVSAYGAFAYVVVELQGGGGVGASINPGDYVQGVIQRDATGGNASDTYPNSIALIAAQFNGARSVIV